MHMIYYPGYYNQSYGAPAPKRLSNMRSTARNQTFVQKHAGPENDLDLRETHFIAINMIKIGLGETIQQMAKKHIVAVRGGDVAPRRQQIMANMRGKASSPTRLHHQKKARDKRTTRKRSHAARRVQAPMCK